jgi:HD-like signal output (HDOD) protein
LAQEQHTLEHWLAFLTEAEIPVLRQTARELARLRERVDDIGARDVAHVIAHDPMMTARLLRYQQAHRHAHQTRELVEIEQALMMMGIGRFFEILPAKPTVEEVLHAHLAALVELMHVVHRAHRASRYAMEWALLLHDLHAEEIRIAALLHDLAEMLMWIYAPAQMLKIRQMQCADKALRSRDAQLHVLGFTLHDLHRGIAAAWNLPELLQVLMEDEHADTRRVKNVKLAVDLARHSANGWDDAALPDDYKGIAELLRLTPDEVIAMVVPTQPGQAA